MRFPIPLTIFAVFVSGPAEGQQLSPLWHTAQVTSEWQGPPVERPGVAALAFGHPDDYRWEGMIAGAVVLGTATAYLANALCGISEQARHCTPVVVGSLLLGGFCGGILGGLLGGLIPKDQIPWTGSRQQNGARDRSRAPLR